MHPLQTAIEHSGEYTCRRYSGRAMYGKECLGVVVKSEQGLGDLFAEILEAIDNQNMEDVPWSMIDVDGIAQAMRTMRIDNMGFDMIVYFPDVEWEDPEISPENEEDELTEEE